MWDDLVMFLCTLGFVLLVLILAGEWLVNNWFPMDPVVSQPPLLP